MKASAAAACERGGRCKLRRPEARDLPAGARRQGRVARGRPQRRFDLPRAFRADLPRGRGRRNSRRSSCLRRPSRPRISSGACCHSRPEAGSTTLRSSRCGAATRKTITAPRSIASRCCTSCTRPASRNATPPILGLAECLRRDAELKALFGLGGGPSAKGEVVWSQVASPADGRQRVELDVARRLRRRRADDEQRAATCAQPGGPGSDRRIPGDRRAGRRCTGTRLVERSRLAGILQPAAAAGRCGLAGRIAGSSGRYPDPRAALYPCSACRRCRRLPVAGSR